MVKQIFNAGLLVFFVLLSGCANLSSHYQQPEINLVSIKPLASENLEQRFLLGLRIINPNNSPLPITGFSYKLSLQGHKILNGASSSNTEIPAFGNQLIELESAASLLGGIGVIRDILMNPNQPFEYNVTLRLHSNWWRLPITLVESGQIDLDN